MVYYMNVYQVGVCVCGCVCIYICSDKRAKAGEAIITIEHKGMISCSTIHESKYFTSAIQIDP